MYVICRQLKSDLNSNPKAGVYEFHELLFLIKMNPYRLLRPGSKAASSWPRWRGAAADAPLCQGVATQARSTRPTPPPRQTGNHAVNKRETWLSSLIFKTKKNLYLLEIYYVLSTFIRIKIAMSWNRHYRI